MRKLTGIIFLLLFSFLVQAGDQRYAPLAASTQTVMQKAISDLAISHLEFVSTAGSKVWLINMSSRLEKFIPEQKERDDFLSTVYYEATRAGLDPQLVLSIIQVESRFRKYAISTAGARGYMQVMPFWVESNRQ